MIRKSPALLFLTTGILVGCASQTDVQEETPKTTPKGGVAKIERIEGAPKLSEEMLLDFEEKHGCKLPDDYRRFLLQYNGGFPAPDCVTFQEAGRTTATDVFCLHCIGDERPWASLEWHHKAFAGRLPKHVLPIGHDSCGNLWLLNVGPEHGGSVVFWDHGSFDDFDETDFEVWPRVSTSFNEFIGNLHEYHPLPEDKDLLSRYALVQRAVEGMAESSDFNKHTVLDGAWHCDYNEAGNIEMQCVDYVTHAVVTHTDGYSDLRAAKGFIESGPSRLPE